jgi:hypothetical protein
MSTSFLKQRGKVVTRPELARRRKSNRDPFSTRLRFEPLEDRRLLSIIFSETFEGVFPGAWMVNDSQGRMWDDTNYKASGGSWS